MKCPGQDIRFVLFMLFNFVAENSRDPESYENMRNAIGLLKLISQGESDVRNGKVRSQEDVFKDIENSLKEKL